MVLPKLNEGDVIKAAYGLYYRTAEREVRGTRQRGGGLSHGVVCK
jgi:hypothetical protein